MLLSFLSAWHKMLFWFLSFFPSGIKRRFNNYFKSEYESAAACTADQHLIALLFQTAPGQVSFLLFAIGNSEEQLRLNMVWVNGC